MLIVGGLVAADLILVGQISRVTLSVALLLLMGLLVRQIAAARDRARLTEQLRTAAITDSLTGLYNRRFFEEKLTAEAKADRRGPLSIVLVDLDHFKTVNDTYGHSVGDVVLAEVADRLRRPLRGSDLLCRYGGEEFVYLLPRTDGPAALDLAERLRADLRAAPVVVPGVAEPLTLTASFGVACADPGGQLGIDELVEAADRALYGAKALGRDRVLGCGPFGQVDAAPSLDLPPALVWLADETDRIRGAGHRSAAVSGWAWATAARLGLDEATQQRTAAAARLRGLACTELGGCHPDRDLSDSVAQDLVDDCRTRPEAAARLLGELTRRPDLVPVLAAHHERHDGTGHPRGLAGNDIPVSARIIAVCDAWADARSTPPPSTPFPVAPRFALAAGRGSRFDPAVLDAFLALVTEGEIADLGPPPRPPIPSHSGHAPG